VKWINYLDCTASSLSPS